MWRRKVPGRGNRGAKALKQECGGSVGGNREEATTAGAVDGGTVVGRELGASKAELCRLIMFSGWFLDQQPQPHPGTGSKCKLSGPTQTS